jgi:hypothetical protein
MKAMKKMIRIPAVIVLLMSFLTSKGGSSDTTAKEIPAASVAARVDSSSLNKKICSCQLMNVKTNQFETQLVGIFAEKTLEGKTNSNYKLMNSFIQRESIYFRIAFTRSAEVKEEVRSATDCLSLYNKLKAGNSRLKMYNILDVDILSALAKR